jgi:Na+-transporting NADH:ubiquinone oxidoreductase subunit NqrD
MVTSLTRKILALSCRMILQVTMISLRVPMADGVGLMAYILAVREIKFA